MNRSKLRQLLDDHLNENELRDLCFDLGIDYENLPPGAKKDKARELILAVENAGRFPELFNWIKLHRPAVNWDEVLGTAVTDPTQEIERLIHEYDHLRKQQKAGVAGVATRHLDDIIIAMRDVALVLSLPRTAIEDGLRAFSDGQRMASLAYLHVNPDERLLYPLLDIEASPGSDRHRSNEEYYALLAVERLVETADLDLRPKLKIKDTLEPRQRIYKLSGAKIRHGVIQNILQKLGDLNW